MTIAVRPFLCFDARADGILVFVCLAAGGVAPFAVAAASSILGGLVFVGVFGGFIWWNANAISHNHLHNPFLRHRVLNSVFDVYISLLTSFPQTIWKERHIWHHHGEPDRRKVRSLGGQGIAELLAVGLLWVGLLVYLPQFFLAVLLPGYVFGLVLCGMQGHYEHHWTRGVVADGISYYGRLYNWIWCNDGYHAEHHRHPYAHWTVLPALRSGNDQETVVSLRPPVLRWIRETR